MANFTPLAQEARRRATLEGERRFCGNRTEELTGNDVEMTKRGKLATALDPRTVNCLHIRHRPDLMKEIKDLLLDAYVAYGLRALEFQDAAAGKEAASTEEPDAAEEPAAAEEPDAAEEPAAAEEAAALAPAAPAVVAAPAPHAAPAAAVAAQTAWSDDEEEEVPINPVVDAAQLRAERTRILSAEFPSKFKSYRKAAAAIDWRAFVRQHDLKIELPAQGPIGALDLWEMPMGLVLKSLYIDTDPSGARFGYLPKMATKSEGSIGSLLASGFPERIISVANRTVTKGNSTLAPDETNMLTVLRMNAKWIEHMRKKYPEVLRSCIGVMDLAENTANSDDDDE